MRALFRRGFPLSPKLKLLAVLCGAALTLPPLWHYFAVASTNHRLAALTASGAAHHPYRRSPSRWMNYIRGREWESMAVAIRRKEVTRDDIAVMAAAGPIEALSLVDCTLQSDSLSALCALLRSHHLSEFHFWHSNSSLTDVSPLLNALKAQPHLVDISMRGSNFSDKDIEALVCHRSLKGVDLAATQISGRGMQKLTALSFLQRLDLSSCTNLIDAANDLALPKSLVSLRADDIPFVAGDFPGLRSCAQLTELSLRDSKVTDAIMHDVAACSQLDNLSIDGAVLGPSGTAELRSLSGLVMLQADRSILTLSSSQGDGRWPSLRSVSLNDATFSDADADKLIAIAPELLECSVNGTQITDQGLKYLATCRSIKTLSFSRTATTDEALRSLMGLAQLQTLDITSTAISEDGLTEFLMHQNTALRALAFNGAIATDKIMETLAAHHPRIRTLVIPGATITPVFEKALEQFRELQDLRLLDAHLRGLPLRAFRALISLRMLELESADLTADAALRIRECLRPEIQVNIVVLPKKTSAAVSAPPES